MHMSRPRVSKLTHAPLARLISKLGIASRTQAAELIRAGRVTVDGQLISDPHFWAQQSAVIKLDGEPTNAAPSALRVLMMHKKRGLVTARVDRTHKVVCDHPNIVGTNLNPVGRLDRSSEGLLLFTSDALLANAISSPESHIDKTYYVRTQRPLVAYEYSALSSGEIDLDGELTLPSDWTSMEVNRNDNWCRVVLREGKNRQIRRMLDVLGVRVQRLIRVGVGPLELGDLPRGHVRELAEDEVGRLKEAVRWTARLARMNKV